MAQTSADRRLLEGMKAIAAHLPVENASPRRLRLWRDKAAMPVHQLMGRWFAWSDELDRWWASLAAPGGTKRHLPSP